MLLHHYIAELLQKHNCVVLPDFGGFVGNTEPAKIDLVQSKILPPYKRIIFNHHLSNNDGLLADYVGKREALDYSAAADFIQEQVERWVAELQKGSRVDIGELGFLYQNNEAIVFEQNREINLCLAAYGLKPVKIEHNSVISKSKVEEKLVVKAAEFQQSSIESKPLVVVNKKIPAEQKVPTIIALDTAKTIEYIPENRETETNVILLDADKSKNKRGWLKYALAAAIIPFAFYSYWIPMKTDFLDTGKIQVADFNPFRKNVKTQYSLRISEFSIEEEASWKSWNELTDNLSANVETYNLEVSEDFYIPVALERTEETISIEKEKQTDRKQNAAFQIIVGCFGVKSNAQNLVTELNEKGYSADIFDKKNGLNRVSAGAFDSQSDAGLKLKALKSQGYSGWILKR